ncbi:SH3 domain-containing protein [Aggregatilineales bacterium SYSU G02658]
MVIGLMAISSAAQAPCSSTDTVRVSTNADCNTDTGIGVGLSRNLESRIIRAVNLFGNRFNAENPAGVCLKGTGALYLSRASLNPRAAFFAWYYVTDDGYTCTNVDSPATVILVEGTSPIAPGQAPDVPLAVEGTSSDAPTATRTPSAPSASQAVGGQIVLTNCQVVTRAILNFRDAPSLNSNVIELIPYRTILRAINRSGDWFNVIYGSNNGWVAASLVNTRGRCE